MAKPNKRPPFCLSPRFARSRASTTCSQDYAPRGTWNCSQEDIGWHVILWTSKITTRWITENLPSDNISSCTALFLLRSWVSDY